WRWSYRFPHVVGIPSGKGCALRECRFAAGENYAPLVPVVEAACYWQRREARQCATRLPGCLAVSCAWPRRSRPAGVLHSPAAAAPAGGCVSGARVVQAALCPPATPGVASDELPPTAFCAGTGPPLRTHSVPAWPPRSGEHQDLAFPYISVAHGFFLDSRLFTGARL